MQYSSKCSFQYLIVHLYIDNHKSFIYSDPLDNTNCVYGFGAFNEHRKQNVNKDNYIKS